jgi:hypothetical protein
MYKYYAASNKPDIEVSAITVSDNEAIIAQLQGEA